MSDGTAPAADRAMSGARDGDVPQLDWTRIEGSDEFRELTRRRHGFIAAAAAVSLGAFLIYLGLAVFATGFMGTLVGGVPVAWLVAMTQVFITWGVTRAYLRKADTEFDDLEQRVIDRVETRFSRTEEEPAARTEATAEDRTTERSAR
jgi:uncharacterized membrane protein (DUF485 family)